MCRKMFLGNHKIILYRLLTYLPSKTNENPAENGDGELL